MKIEKLDRVVVYVENLEEAKQTYSNLLGIEFDEIPFESVQPIKLEPGDVAEAPAQDAAPVGQKVAISRAGLELIEGSLQPGQSPQVACFHFKVSDYEGAKAEMAEKRLPLLLDITLGTLREAIYRPQGEDGPMMGLVSYPDSYVMDSIKSKG
jgi:hypothetical protein